ncbi:hypothetical protein [Luteibacter yeojuensis]
MALRWVVGAFVALGVVSVAWGQSVTVPEDYHSYSERAENSVIVGGVQLGDQTEFSTGQTTFEHTVVSLPGDNALPVTAAYQYLPYQTPDIHYTLELERPYVSGVFSQSTGWVATQSTAVGTTARCSVVFGLGAPPEVHNTDGKADTFFTDEYWHGNHLVLPGGSSEFMNQIATSNAGPTDGAAYHWTTKSHWYFSCQAGTNGETFVGVSPEGLRYYFNQEAQGAPVSALVKDAELGGTTVLQRKEVRFYATRIEDRFGNWVKYDTVNGALVISSNDGRSLTLTTAGAVTTVTDGTRTWAVTSNGATYDSSGFSVTNPDGSVWSLVRTGSITRSAGYILGCTVPPATFTGQSTVTVNSPSGAVGTFTLAPVRFGKSQVPYRCYYSGGKANDVIEEPAFYDSVALTNKTVSGAGIDPAHPLSWQYEYGPANGCYTGGTPAPSVQCTSGSPTTRTVVVHQPDTRIVRYTFDNNVRSATEGLLLTRETGDSTASIARTEATTWTSFDVEGFIGNHAGSSGVDDLLRVPQQKTINQDGDTYTWLAEAFDTYGEPTKVKRSNTIAGQTPVDEQITYLNDKARWIISMPLQLDTLTSTGIQTVDKLVLDANDLPAESWKFGRKVASYTYDSLARLATVADGRGNVTHYSNYKLGIPQRIDYPDGTAKTATVDNVGQITFTTDQNNANTAYQYDNVGRLTRIGYTGADGIPWDPTTIAYEFVGSERGITGNHWRSTVTRGKEDERTYFDALLRPILTGTYRNTDGALHIGTRTDYDWQGNKTFVSFPVTPAPDSMWNIGGGVVMTYDALGRVTTSQQLYTEFGTLTTTTNYLSGARIQVTDPKGYITTTSYQVFDLPSYDKVIQVAAPEYVTQTIARDVWGNPTSITQGGNGVSVTRRMAYDANKRVCRTIDPESGNEVMAYDGADNLAWSASGLSITGADTDCGQEQVAAAAKTTRAYDTMNRLTSVDYPAGTDDAGFTYDPLGNLKTATSGSVTWTYVRNKLGLLTGESLSVDGHQWAFGYGYDYSANLATIVYPGSETVNLMPDAHGRPTQVGAYASGIGYFADGGVEQFSFGNGTSYLAEQNARKLIGNFSYGTGTLLISEQFDYDKNANVSQITDLMGGQRSKVLGYDQLNRLTSAYAEKLWGNETYTYDTVNNIRSLTNSGGNNVYNYDTLNLLRSINHAGTVENFQYDPRGNTTGNGRNATMVFDQANRLTSIAGKGTYLYDAAGRRVKKQQDGAASPIYYAYTQNGQLMFQYDPSTLKSTNYFYVGRKLIARSENANAPEGVPVLNGPATGQINTLYGLAWTAVPGATSYLLEEQVNGATWAQVSNLNELSHAQQHTGPANFGYRVSACNAGACGATSNVVTVNVLPPPSAPAAPDTVNAVLAADRLSITLSWSAVADATSYVAQQQVNGGGWVALYSGTALSTVRATPMDGAIAFQVQACNASGCGPWKTTGAVTVAHIPSTPASISVPATSSGQVGVSWAASTFAASYTLQQSVNGGGWTTVYASTGTSTMLNEGATGSYTFRVQACDAAGCSDFRTSSAVAVTLLPAGTPGISAPAASTNGAYTVSWSGVAGATSYNLQEQFNGGAWGTVQNNGATSWSTSNKGSGTYGYRVQACNVSGCAGFSGTASVSVTIIPAIPGGLHGTIWVFAGAALVANNAAMRPARPPDSYELDAAWSTSPGATSYDLQYCNGGCQIRSAGAASSILSIPVTSTHYTISVRACNASGCSPWSAAVTPVVQQG